MYSWKTGPREAFGPPAFLILLFLFVGLTMAVEAVAQEPGKPLPAWTPGTLDLHHINTGHGDAAFYVFPDGTTMLLDAGEMDPKGERMNTPRNAALHPDASRPAHEWIAEYIKQFYPLTGPPVLDYALITHFHDDHFGAFYEGAKKSQRGSYYLTGITGVGELIPIKMLLDRGYPDYNYPHALKQDSVIRKMKASPAGAAYYRTFENYWQFIAEQQRQNGMKVEQVRAGSIRQIRLKRSPKSYPDFIVRNIKANGQIWTGSDSTTFAYFPALKPGGYVPGENQLSVALRIQYGAFRYYTGGDNPGVADLGQPVWNDVETPMAKVVGEVDVAVMDHHGNRDAHNELNVKTLRPRVWIQQTWSSDHPGHEVLRRVTSTYLYEGDRDLFATNILEANKNVIGPALERAYKSTSGHIVVRVAPGGQTYRVIVLNDENEKREVLSVHGPYQAKTKPVR